MSKKFRSVAAGAALLIAVMFSMTACDNGAGSGQTSPGGYTSENPNPKMNSASDDSDSSDTTGQLRLSYTGKMGMDMGNGIVMPLNGGTPQIGGSMGFGN